MSGPARNLIIEALQPFADFAVDGMVPDDHVITQGSPMAKRQLTMGDCRVAKQVLEVIMSAGDSG